MAKEYTNIPSEPLRWSTYAAEREFNIDKLTLDKRLAEAGIAAGPDSLYSTAQILAAVTGGSLQAERLAKIRSEREYRDLKNAEMRGELLSKAKLLRSVKTAFQAIRQVILSSPLPSQAQDTIFKHLLDYRPPE